MSVKCWVLFILSFVLLLNESREFYSRSPVSRVVLIKNVNNKYLTFFYVLAS